MTLEEFCKIVSDTSQKAHLFIHDGITPKRVKSVSLRLDDDGTLSIVCHPGHMKNRIATDEANKNIAAMNQLRELYKREPGLHGAMDDFDGFYVHWDEITEALSASGHCDYDESPMELITKLIDERDELQEKLDTASEPVSS